MKPKHWCLGIITKLCCIQTLCTPSTQVPFSTQVRGHLVPGHRHCPQILVCVHIMGKCCVHISGQWESYLGTHKCEHSPSVMDSTSNSVGQTLWIHSYSPNLESKDPLCKERSLSVNLGPSSWSPAFFWFLKIYLQKWNSTVK